MATLEIRRKFILGTAQFQLGYGATGETLPHATAEALASDILSAMGPLGIDLLDTAAAYGDSESLIGRHLPDATGIGIVTKSPPWHGRPEKEAAGDWMIGALQSSLRHLGRKTVYGLLFHSPDAFEGPDRNRVIDALDAVKASGLAQNVGVSVYTAEQVDRVLEHWMPDIVQLPVSIVDQRLVDDGTIARLSTAGVEIHARSVFLRGMLLLRPEKLPGHLQALKPALSDIDREFNGYSVANRLAACLSAVGRIEQVSRILVGAESADQLHEICSAAARADTLSGSYKQYAQNDPKILNPGLWPPE